MVPEMGIHLLLREPPFLWKRPLSIFKLVCCRARMLFNSAHVRGCESVQARHAFSSCGCSGQAWTRLHHGCASVCEVRAVRRHRKLVVHDSAANQQGKWLWVSPYQANLWLQSLLCSTSAKIGNEQLLGVWKRPLRLVHKVSQRK